AEMSGVYRTDHHAGGLAVLGRQILIVDPVNAQRAFFHDPLVGVELAGAVGAGPGAQLAADADGFVHQHDAVLGALIGCPGWAHGDASRLLAMQTGFREVNCARALSFPFLKRMNSVEPNAPGTIAVRMEVGEWPHMAARVPFFASRRASV